ncbi:MAG: tetratricopeptide repeat protein [Methylococcaceae bacterium]|nr:tetratricopeptide repeat protein [Methylococcaceae bacterium]
MQSIETELLAPEQAFKWPRQAVTEHNWIEAAQRWTVLRKAYPNHPATWFQCANALIKAGDLKQAEILLNQARQQFPNHPNSLIDFAILAIQRQEWIVAEDFLQQAREKHPDNVQSWLISAECAEGINDLDQASKYYEKACQITPDHPGSFIQLAELAMRNKQWQQALDRWETLRNYFPDIPAGYLRAAEAAHQLNQPKKARKLILEHQYGTDVFDNNAHSQNTKKNGTHTNISRLLQLIWTKANFNLRSEVHRNYLSYGWWILEPLLHMVIYYVVFGMLLKRGGENYPVFLLTGLIPWMWFSKAVIGSSGSILAGQNIMLQVGVPSIFFPLVILLQTTIKQLPVFLLLIGFVWLQGYPPEIHWYGLVPIVIVQAILTIAFSCAVAAVIPFIRDLSYLVPTGLTFLMFLSGIFYDYRSIAADWQDLFLLNPFAFLLKCYREIFIEGVLPDFVTLTWWGLGSAAMCLLLMLAYQRLRYVYPRIVME